MKNRSSSSFFSFVHTALVAAGIFMMSSAANATPATRDPGVNRRQANQAARIRAGVQSGELTHDEAEGLRGEIRAIRHEERAMKSDGTLTAAERAKLQSDLDKSSADIHAEKHDAATRPASPARTAQRREVRAARAAALAQPAQPTKPAAANP